MESDSYCVSAAGPQLAQHVVYGAEGQKESADNLCAAFNLQALFNPVSVVPINRATHIAAK